MYPTHSNQSVFGEYQTHTFRSFQLANLHNLANRRLRFRWFVKTQFYAFQRVCHTSVTSRSFRYELPTNPEPFTGSLILPSVYFFRLGSPGILPNP